MRRFLTVCSFLLFAIPIIAQNSLTIIQKDGQEFNYGFEEKPVITYSDNELVLKTATIEFYYPLTSIAKIVFSDVEIDGGTKDIFEEDVFSEISDNIETSIQNHFEKLNPIIENQILNISGTRPGADVLLISIEGRVLKRCKANLDGCVSFGLLEYSAGVYIIVSEKKSCKIVKI